MKKVENMAKGEIVCFEQFLLSPQFFQKRRLAAAKASESVFIWERVKLKIWKVLDTAENCVSKGEIIYSFSFCHHIFKSRLFRKKQI